MKKNEETKEKRPLLSYLFFIILFLGITYIYAHYIGTTGLSVREYNIKSAKIPESFDGFSIVQFSDLELGSTFNIDDLDNLVKNINALKPDIVLFTGDILSDKFKLDSKNSEIITSKLKIIDPLIGKYAIKGDDDMNKNVYDLILRSGFKDLTNNYELIYYKGMTPIVLIGIDSLTKGNPNVDSAFTYPMELPSYHIVMTHEPDTVNLLKDYDIDLILAGHSHNNEINIPYLRDLYKIDGAKNYYNKEYDIDGKKLYISGGLGTSDLEMRLFNRPSISIYRLYVE